MTWGYNTMVLVRAIIPVEENRSHQLIWSDVPVAITDKTASIAQRFGGNDDQTNLSVSVSVKKEWPVPVYPWKFLNTGTLNEHQRVLLQ